MKYVILFLLAPAVFSLPESQNVTSKTKSGNGKLNCKDIKCPLVEEPVCVKMKNKKLGLSGKDIYIMLFNKCELEYMKCHQGLQVKIVSMKNCGHGSKSAGDLVGTKRVKREASEVSEGQTDKPKISKQLGALEGLTLFESQGILKPVSDSEENQDSPEIIVVTEPREVPSNITASSNGKKAEVVLNKENLENKPELAEEKTEEETDINFHDVDLKDSEEKRDTAPNEEDIENEDDDDKKEDKIIPFDDRGIPTSPYNISDAVDIQSAPEAEPLTSIEEKVEEQTNNNNVVNEKSYEETHKGVKEDVEESDNGNIVSEKSKEEGDTKDVKEVVEESDNGNIGSEKSKEEGDTKDVKEDVEESDNGNIGSEKSKEEGDTKDVEESDNDNIGSEKSKEEGDKKDVILQDVKQPPADTAEFFADYDAKTANEEVDLEQYDSDCPSVCPAKEMMVCARCKDRIFRTFMSICHLRMFNCKHSDEKMELVSRHPCVLSAPYLASMPEPKGRISEPGDSDVVLRFIRCREKDKLDGSRKCKFDPPH